jgi:hypothetical protein
LDLGDFRFCGGFDLGDFRYGGRRFGDVEYLIVEGVFVEGEGLLLGFEGVEFGLAFFAEQAGELGERYGLFGGVDDSFDLGFKAHG